MTCSECPTVLTAAQLARGNVTCSRRCGAARGNRLLSPAEKRRAVQPAIEAWRRVSTRRVLLQIHADLRQVATPAGLVSIGDAARVVRLHRELGYERGYNARYQQKIRRRRALQRARLQVSRGTREASA
jgi:hypothetical protein